MKNPWRTLDSREVYRGGWLSLREDRVIRPDGKEGLYSVVSPRGAAVKVVALDSQERVHLVGQFRYPTQFASWEIPGGAAEQGESPLEAARRELREEAGVEAEDWVQLGGRIQTNNSLMDEVGFLFLARRAWRAGGPELDAEEAIESRLLPFGEALAMADRGEIEDVMSIIGLLRTARMLERGA
ncbi:MAG: mismatch repair protein MutT [Myxococcaceae bacterium]|nr:mismatch repair protein MutT [Myxococcaceae bacterium]